MLRIVCEEDPPRPSIKLSTANKLASISADRGTEPKKLTGLLRNELDWIVMKALEKDRARRYETVNGFAADIQRYLAGEAVQAHPPSAAYRLRKFARKHRVGLATAAAFAGLLIAAAVVSSLLAVKANRAEAVADDKRIEAETNAEEAREIAELYQKELNDNVAARIEAEITAKSLQIDLDLSELRTDPKVGLLRLARPLKQNLESLGSKLALFDPTTGQALLGGAGNFTADNRRGDYKALRQFLTAAILAAGQQYAPLLPPITHDGQPVAFAWFSPDNQTLLTLGKDGTVRLWETRTFRPIAVLRQGNERVINCGFTPDGRTVFTDDQTSVARFWDVPTGQYRAAIEARKNRYEAADNSPSSVFFSLATMGANRLLTRRGVVKKPEFHNEGQVEWWDPATGQLVAGAPKFYYEGPVELWDTATGRLVARLDAPGRKLIPFRFTNQGRWITTLDERGSTLLVFSAEDGRLLARLTHPAEESGSPLLDVSPTGRSIATVTQKQLGGGILNGFFCDVCIRVWDVERWQVRSLVSLPHMPVSRAFGIFHMRYLMDDAFGGSFVALDDTDPAGWKVYPAGGVEPGGEFPSVWPDLLARAGDLVHAGNGRVYDTRTWRRLLPPTGRKFHPDLARFSPDGRFISAVVDSEWLLIDTRTDKQLPVGGWHHLPGFGLVSNLSQDGLVSTGQVGNGEVQFIPPAHRLEFPRDLLELWAQVAVRGHLDDQGTFVKWDEPTWEKKRQELAAKPAPYADFPFPGYLAMDKLHWLRAEFDEAVTDADKLRIVRKLLRRCEAAGDRVEAVRWRAEETKLSRETAPPREGKP
jgi:WD40 repeat protein